MATSLNMTITAIKVSQPIIRPIWYLDRVMPISLQLFLVLTHQHGDQTMHLRNLIIRRAAMELLEQ